MLKIAAQQDSILECDWAVVGQSNSGKYQYAACQYSRSDRFVQNKPGQQQGKYWNKVDKDSSPAGADLFDALIIQGKTKGCAAESKIGETDS